MRLTSSTPMAVVAKPAMPSLRGPLLPVRGSSAAGATRTSPRTVGAIVVVVVGAAVVVVVVGARVVVVVDVVVVAAAGNTFTKLTIVSSSSGMTAVPSAGVTVVEAAPPASVSSAVHSVPGA